MVRVMCLATVIACSAPAPVARQVAPPVVIVDAGPPPDARPLDQDLPRLIERSLAMYRAIADAFTASGEDCAGAIVKLGEIAARDRDVVAANAQVLHDGRAADLRAALEPHGETFDAAARAIMQSPTLAKCASDPTFARAFDAVFSP